MISRDDALAVYLKAAISQADIILALDSPIDKEQLQHAALQQALGSILLTSCFPDFSQLCQCMHIDRISPQRLDSHSIHVMNVVSLC